MHFKFLIIKPTRCTNFLNLFLELNSTCFGQFLCPSSGVFRCTHSNVVRRTILRTGYKQDQDGTSFRPDPAHKLTANRTIVQQKTLDDGQRNCPKHVEFHFKNKFEKLVHLVGFIIRNLTRCTVTRTSKMSFNIFALQIFLWQ
jgi:hypothetical protein